MILRWFNKEKALLNPIFYLFEEVQKLRFWEGKRLQNPRKEKREREKLGLWKGKRLLNPRKETREIERERPYPESVPRKGRPTASFGPPRTRPGYGLGQPRGRPGPAHWQLQFPLPTTILSPISPFHRSTLPWSPNLLFQKCENLTVEPTWWSPNHLLQQVGWGRLFHIFYSFWANL